MDALASATAVVLAAVFAWAAVAKVLRPAQTRASFAALELPAPTVLARAVPAAEIAIGAGLVFVPPFAAPAAVAVLVVFTIVLVRAMATGAGAPCSCFGSARAEPVSGTEIVRNGLLAAAAVVASGAPSGIDMSPPLPAFVLATTAFALGRVILAVVDLRRATGRLWPTVDRGYR